MRWRPQGRRRNVDRGTSRPGIQPRKTFTPERRRCKEKRKAISDTSPAQGVSGHARTHLAREPGEPWGARRGWRGGPRREVYGHTPTMNGPGEAGRPVVPAKSPNNAARAATEGAGGKGLAQGKPSQANAPRTLSADGAGRALGRGG